MNKIDYLYLAMLHSIGITHKKLHLIFSNKKNYKEFYEGLNHKILLKYGFLSNQAFLILDNKKNINIENIEKKLIEREVKIVTFFDTLYPEAFKNIPNSPFLFYLRGQINNSPKIAVVGSRKISSYGENVVKNIIPDLSNYFTIVSGGAAGCDSFAHIESINTGNKTLSIIGTGIDLDYPIKNKKLYDNIVINGGGVISIFPVGEVGNPYNFPVRNELVAGISNGVLVIEAGEKSGTLITANLALDLGKDLFVVPGEIFKKNSIGCNNLIKNGCAKLITCTQDILEEYNILSKNIKNTQIKFSDKIEEDIYNMLLLEDLSINELSKKIELDIQTVLFKIGFMEINNYVKKSSGGKYCVC